ncbi:Protein of unknown function DUF669 [uncultured Caudovirales phage]|uniref:DUF669 domain-containing protein n=1 Tax=uncultured Caudovirales phage TaxID=2100421 RepID=A0A6J5RY34_9CAUD|nr:Protein of unknown function DUF669 [uncultured Caudovirales phage]
MARLNETFNANELPEDTGGDFTPLPAGDYNVTIQDAEIKDTKSKTGQYINLKLEVTGPTHMGRLLFAIVNIKNESSVSEQIGRGQLGSILRALGIETLEDTDQLLGGPLCVKVALKAASGQYPAGNEIKAYKAQGDAPALAARPPVAAKPAPASAPAKAAPPWAKRG